MLSSVSLIGGASGKHTLFVANSRLFRRCASNDTLNIIHTLFIFIYVRIIYIGPHGLRLFSEFPGFLCSARHDLIPVRIFDLFVK